MVRKIFCVYDSKVGAYLQPFFAASKGEAIRSFSDVCNDSNSMFYKHSEDYTLFELGSFDDQSAVLTSNNTPISLGLAHDFKKLT